jgi:histidine triad (HIT) family protein
MTRSKKAVLFTLIIITIVAALLLSPSCKKVVGTWLFSIARSQAASFFIGVAFEHLTCLMPINRLDDGERVIIFPHPVPLYETHLLAVPKLRLASFMAIDFHTTTHQRAIFDTFRAIQRVATQQKLTEYTVLVNGGAYQDVPQVHFHIVSGVSTEQRRLGTERFSPPHADSQIERYQSALAYFHPQPLLTFHLIVTTRAVESFTTLDSGQRSHLEALCDMLELAQHMIETYHLTRYTLLCNMSSITAEPQLTFHLVSEDSPEGKRRNGTDKS